MFELHERLSSDTFFLASLELSQVRLMNDARFPWLILVPKRAGLCELHDLGPKDRVTLIEEISVASGALSELFVPDKLNVATLGNLVPQLHIHVLARFKGDPAWPGPVWGQGAALSYDEVEAKSLLMRLLPFFTADQAIEAASPVTES